MSTPTTPRRLSLWGGGPWQDPTRVAEAREVAAEVEELGFARLWFSGGFAPGILPAFGELLSATTSLGVASGIVSIWTATPAQSAAAFADLERDHPGRFLLGLGNSHAPAVEGQGRAYEKPFTRTAEYLDQLDALSPSVPADRRVLAALGPKMLDLARTRTAGAHPYFTTVEHTVSAREALGPEPLLAPEVAVVLETDPSRARAIAREYAAMYLALPNYTNNLRRFGWGDADLLDGGSDRAIDALIPWGTVGQVAARLEEQFAAGADEVPVQVLGGGGDFPREQFRLLAEAFAG